MNGDNLSDLPEWADERFYNEDMEGQEWKPNTTYYACKALYEKPVSVLRMSVYVA
jgi:hypothetical protein